MEINRDGSDCIYIACLDLKWCGRGYYADTGRSPHTKDNNIFFRRQHVVTMEWHNVDS